MKKINKIISIILCAVMIFTCFSLMVFADNECEHAYSTTVVAPSCADQGYTLHTCSKCGDYYKDSYTSALGHLYTNKWTVINEADCTHEGLEQRECSRCKALETKTISVLDHVDKDGNGKCDRCGEKMEVKNVFAPFDWIVALIKAVKEWFAAIFA